MGSVTRVPLPRAGILGSWGSERGLVVLIFTEHIPSVFRASVYHRVSTVVAGLFRDLLYSLSKTELSHSTCLISPLPEKKSRKEL